MSTKNPASSLGALQDAVERRLRQMNEADIVERVWARDPTVWKPDAKTPEITNRLGWLDVAGPMLAAARELRQFAEEARRRFDRVVLCGMGGSSLAPEVLHRTFGSRAGFPRLTVLDTTEPGTVAAVGSTGERLARTLFIISSKSGTTQETASLAAHFWQATGEVGAQFVAVTDPGTPLERLARARGFRRTFVNPPEIGGRYSALSYFGLVPAAAIGVDVAALLRSAQAMAARCRDQRARQNPGAWLGAVVGEAALAGRDKLTLVCSRRLASFGLWAEQLVAESSGKEGKGIVPVVEPSPGAPLEYGTDRLFVRMRLTGEDDPVTERALARLQAAGHPVVRIELPDRAELGASFFGWEFAVAAACAIIGVNAFDQPNVAESKENTRELLASGVPAAAAAAPDLSAFLAAIPVGHYLALLAYQPLSEAVERRLTALAGRLRERTHVAVTWGLGPRYLHSTGQLHKGGPPIGHFVIVAAEPTARVPIPEQPFDFGTLFRAQSEGDRQALARRDLPVVRLASLEVLEAAAAA
jgi:glucose-6-phosphate isomerase